MLRILVKFWPALIPIITYFIWILFLREIFLSKKNSKDSKGPKVINMEKKYTVLNDPKFLASIFLSFVILIIMFIFLAFSNVQDKGDKYVPAKYENGQLIPAKKLQSE